MSLLNGWLIKAWGNRQPDFQKSRTCKYIVQLKMEEDPVGKTYGFYDMGRSVVRDDLPGLDKPEPFRKAEREWLEG